MGAYQALGSLATPQMMVMPHTLLIGGGVQVNVCGQRFENELEDISGQALNILAQPEGLCWMVFDQRLHEQALATFQEYRDADDINTAKRGNSWQELAATTGMPADMLADTMQQVKALCAEHAVDPFGRRFARSDALAPPYLGIRVTGALFHTQGGLSVDERARVQRSAGGSLPNLFCRRRRGAFRFPAQGAGAICRAWGCAPPSRWDTSRAGQPRSFVERNS